MKKMIKPFSIATLAGTMIFAAGTASAESAFEGKSNFICAAMDVVACVNDGVCSRGQARDFEMPEFMDVDVKAMVLRASYEGGKEAISPIKNMAISGTQLILQGIENDHGWSLAVHRENGRMSIGVAGDEVSFTLFGACKGL